MSLTQTITVHPGPPHTHEGEKPWEATQTLYTHDESRALVHALRDAGFRAAEHFHQRHDPVDWSVSVDGLSGAEVDRLIRGRRGRRSTG